MVMLLSCCFIGSLQARVIYVDLSSGAGNDDGTSWSDAYLDLQDAIFNASSGDTIFVSDDTYYPTSSTVRTISFELKNGVALFGGFKDGENTLSERSGKTSLSGDLNKDDGANFANNADNSYTVVYIYNVSANTILDGFIISGGNADNASIGNTSRQKAGGGIYNKGTNVNNASLPSIRNCIIQGNRATSYGGGVYNDGSYGGDASMSFNNCIITNNHAGSSGGGVYNDGGVAGVCNPNFTKCTIAFNTSFDSGGGFMNTGIQGECSPILLNCIINNNIADFNNDTNGYGGAMYNHGKEGVSNPQVTSCLFYENRGYAGGAIYNFGTSFGDASPTLTNCTFYGNFAIALGGAMYSQGGSEIGNSRPMVTNCIFQANSAGNYGPCFQNNFGGPIISYSILDLADCDAVASGGNSEVNCGSGMLYLVDPVFKDTINHDFSLLAGSSAYNVGDNTAIDATNTTTDLACTARKKNGIVDLGAYEFDNILPVELFSFTAKEESGKVYLNWVTASEKDNDYFVLERSQDGRQFSAIAQVMGAGNSSFFHTYNEIDENPYNGISYYRLQQVDYDGAKSYSHIVVVSIEQNLKINIFPNPAVDVVNISFSEFKAGRLDYQVYNLSGKLMSQGFTEVNKGISHIRLDEIHNLQPGAYFLRVSNAKGISYVERFMKVGL